MDKSFNYKEYVQFDDDEQEILSEIENKNDTSLLVVKQQELRKCIAKKIGVFKNKNDGEYIDLHTITDYCLQVSYMALFNGERYIYNMQQHFYEKLPDSNLLKLIYELVSMYNERLYNTRLGKLCLELCDTKMDSYKNISTMNTGRYLVFENGTYDLDEDRFIFDEFFLDAYNTSVLRYPFEGGTAKVTKWLNTLNDIFNHDYDKILSLQELFGYTLYRGNDYPIQKLFIFHGSGRNGKGVVAHMLEKVIGSEKISATPLDKLSTNFGFQDCYDKWVNISPERENQNMLDTTFIKSLTGGDSVTIEQKYKNSFSTKVRCKFILLTNSHITTNDNSKGFYDRLHIFEFPNNYYELIEGEERKEGVLYQDPLLEQKIEKELPGIFYWSLVGYRRLREKGWKLTITKNDLDIKKRFYYETNPVKHFSDSCLEFKSGEKISAIQLFNYFCKWKDKNNISSSGVEDKSSFQRVLLQVNGNKIYKQYYSGSLFYFGISLKNDYIEKTII